MASTDVNNSWEKIQRGVKDTERLIGQKDYNSSMVKARQTLEFMVRLLAERACIVDNGDLMATIDSLYQNRWISKATCEHYHKIRIIGNNAAHEGDNNAYNANQAYHMLSQEVYTFANDYRNAQRGAKPARSSSSGSGRPSSGRSTAPASRPQNQSQAAARSRRRQPQKRAGFTIYDLLKLLIPVLCIVLLVLVIKLVKPAKDDKPSDTSAPVTTEQTDATLPEEPTEPTETTAPAVVYKTSDTLNVRPAPNTTDPRIGQLEAGVTVEYVRAHDDEWAVIMYNGQEAYVASRYLTTE